MREAEQSHGQLHTDVLRVAFVVNFVLDEGMVQRRISAVKRQRVDGKSTGRTER